MLPWSSCDWPSFRTRITTCCCSLSQAAANCAGFTFSANESKPTAPTDIRLKKCEGVNFNSKSSGSWSWTKPPASLPVPRLPKSCAMFCQVNQSCDACHPDDDGYNLLATQVFTWIVKHKTRAAASKTDDGGTAASIAFKRNFEPEGAWGDHGQEASPFHLNGKLYLMQSIFRTFPHTNGSKGVHSGFCIYDARTGETVSCPDSSKSFAFCSAIVDHTAPPQRLWVFCSAWDRANRPPGHSYGLGACDDAKRGVGTGTGCFVASWSTEDLR